jgi:LacI family transcriptional regulator
MLERTAMTRRPTLVDVSTAANVSTFTASRALAGKSGVSAATRETVERIARELGYISNAAAASLKGQGTRSIGLMMATGENEYYSRLSQGIEAVVSGGGMQLITTNAFRDNHVDRERERQQLQGLVQQRVDALIATYPLADESVELLDRWGIPVVFAGSPPIGSAADRPYVGVDNLAASRLVVEHFASLGLTDTVFMTYPSFWTTRADRERGYVEAARELGIGCDVVESENFSEAAVSTLRAYVSGRGARGLPAAICAANIPILQGVMKALRQLGASIPGDVSVVGFDDFDWADLLEPPLTVIDEQVAEIGRHAGAMALDLVGDRAERPAGGRGMVRLIEPILIVRSSTMARMPQ